MQPSQPNVAKKEQLTDNLPVFSPFYSERQDMTPLFPLEEVERSLSGDTASRTCIGREIRVLQGPGGNNYMLLRSYVEMGYGTSFPTFCIGSGAKDNLKAISWRSNFM